MSLFHSGAMTGLIRLSSSRVFACLAALVAISACYVPEPETHLLRPGFTGQVLIIFGDPDGEPADSVDGRTIFRIPADGILRTRLPERRLSTDVRYFYEVGESGSGQKITGRSSTTIHDTAENRADDTVVIHSHGIGTVGDGSQDDLCSVVYHRYSVGRKRDLIGRREQNALDYLRENPVRCAADDPEKKK